MKRRIRNIDTCLCLFPQGAFLLSSRLDSAVKCCSIEVLKLSFQPELLGKGSGPKRLDEVLIRSEQGGGGGGGGWKRSRVALGALWRLCSLLYISRCLLSWEALLFVSFSELSWCLLPVLP